MNRSIQSRGAPHSKKHKNHKGSNGSHALKKVDEKVEVNEDASDEENEDDDINTKKSGSGQSRAALKRKKNKEKRMKTDVGSSISYIASKSDAIEDNNDGESSYNDAYDDEYISDDLKEHVESKEISHPLKKAKFAGNNNKHKIHITINSKFDHCKSIQEILEISSTSIASNAFVDCSSKLLGLLVSPTEINHFFADFWSKTPLVCQVNKSGGAESSGNNNRSKVIYKGLFSTKKLERILDTQILQFSNDIDIVRYANSNQESVHEDTENTEPVEVSAADVKQKFSEGYSIEYKTCTKHDDTMWRFISHLEHVLESAIEPIVSWSPKGDTVQARGPRVSVGDLLLLQLDGSSKIDIYAPIQGVLSDSDINAETPLPESPYMTIETKTGDSVYIPRGWITTTRSTKEANSLSLELKFNVNNTYHELLEMVLPQALAAASVDNSSIRGALPWSWSSYMGVAHSELDVEDERRDAFKVQLKKNLMAVVNSVMEHCDAAMDQLAKAYVSRRLPFPITDDEERRSVIKSKDVVIASYTKLRVMRPNMARAVIEDGMVVVYHCQDNARELFGAPLNPLEFELDDGPAIEVLLNAYPNGVTVMDLPHPSDELDDKIGVADALFREGILIIEDEATAGRGEGSDAGSQDDSDDDCPF